MKTTVDDSITPDTPPTTGAPEGAFQREEIDATVRAASGQFVSDVDRRGLAIASEAVGRLVAERGELVQAWSTFRDEVTVTVTPGDLVEVATWMRDTAGFALLSDLSPCDRAGSVHEWPARFSIQYVVTRLVPGAPRVRLETWVDEGDAVPTLIGVYPTADWHEREAFDFFGIEFSGREAMRRLIMAEDWEGHPLRKDYPMGGEPVKFTNSAREI